VRLDVLPLLGEVAGRDLVPVLARQAELLSDEAALLDQLAAGVDPTDAKALRSAPEPLARRAVRRWLRDLTDERHPPSAAEIARVMAVARGTAKACEVAGGHRIRRTGGRLVLVERQ
jgi:tRNA(Ile)-lysidine synthase